MDYPSPRMMYRSRFLQLAFSIFALAVCGYSQTQPHGIVTGIVYDAASKNPLSQVTLRVASTGKSTLANDEGSFRISVPYGDYKFIFSRVGHQPDTLPITVADSLQILTIYLQPAAIELPTVNVYERQYDAAQLIIRNAILRKKNILSMLHDYEFTAYTKLLVGKTDTLKKKPIEFITETQLKGYWEKPNRYKEVITSRRQSANINAEDNEVTIGDILNFNTNRIEIERYKIVSPTAEDAMEYYNYYLLDTLFIDGRRLFHLEIEPKSQTTPLFVGTIDIADSSYAVAGVDVGFNELFNGSMMKNARYSQKLSPFQDSIWMPTEIRFTGDIKIPLPGIPMYHLDYVAALHEYQFNQGLPKGIMNEFALEVDKNADTFDSTAWNAQTFIPLTKEEEQSYKRIDSVEHAPKPLGLTIIKYTLLGALAVTMQPDLFHYNRVEGAYLGFGMRSDDLPNTILSAKAGYAFAAHRWEQSYRATYQLWQQHRLRLNAEYHDRFETFEMLRPHVDYNPTMDALLFQTDPYDYYRERGFLIGASISPLRHFKTSITYTNVNQFIAVKNTDYAVFPDDDHRFPGNPPITVGRDRSIGVALQFDNRPLVKKKQTEERVSTPTYTTFEISAQFASPDFTHSNFDYSQYRVSLHEKFRLGDWGITTLAPTFGFVTGSPSPQQRFYATRSFLGEITDFKTTLHRTFAGDRLYSVYVVHDFGRILFRKMHLPTHLPLTFQVYSGAFWLKNEETYADSETLPATIKKPYAEIGFGIGRIPPVSFSVYFTYQLSKYRYTDSFSFLLANLFNF